MDECVAILGLGEIGLALATALASRGCSVVGCDIDDALVTDLRRDRSRGPAAMLPPLRNVVSSGHLSFETALQPVDRNRTFIIAVPTPLSDGVFDDRPLLSAIAAVRKVARPGDLVVLKSTVPIGTTRSLSETFIAAGGKIFVAYSPDRSVSGRAFEEQFSIPHIVGATSRAAQARAVRLFGLLGRVITVASPETAEAIKLFTNVQRDVIFGLANEFALMCESLGLDMHEIAQAGAIDYPRERLPRPGPVGGSCLSKDTFLLASSVAAANAPKLALAARAGNEEAIRRAARWIAAQPTMRNEEAPRVAMLGIAFKGVPVTTDVRGSVAVSLMRLLRQMIPAVAVRAWDAVVSPDTLADCGFLPSSDIMSAAKDVSVIVIANDHPVFRQLPVGELAAVMRKPGCIYDLCGILGRVTEIPEGITIKTFGVGNPSIIAAADEASFDTSRPDEKT